MTILGRKVKYTILETLDGEDMPSIDIIRSGLENGAFPTHPWPSTETVRMGSCKLDSLHDFDFNDVASWSTYNYLVFGIRIDNRKPSSKLVKSDLDKAMRSWKKEHEVERVPNSVKTDLRDMVVSNVLSSTRPIPKMVEVCIDLEGKRAVVTGATKKELDDVRKFFLRNFNIPLRRESILEKLSSNGVSWADALKYILKKSTQEGFFFDHEEGCCSITLDSRVRLTDNGKDLNMLISGDSNAGECEEALNKNMVPIEVSFCATLGENFEYSFSVHSEDLILCEVQTPYASGEDFLDSVTVKMMLFEKMERAWRQALEQAAEQALNEPQDDSEDLKEDLDESQEDLLQIET